MRTAIIVTVLLGLAGFASAAGGLERIDVVVGDCICGNHMASFDTVYKGKKIEVALYYGGTTKFLRDKNEIKEWHDTFCPKVGADKGPLSGKMVTVTGKWQNPNAFQASKIHLKP